MSNFSIKNRATDLRHAQEQAVDLIIIGGGITGAGVLRDAAMRGLNTVLIEQDDFASGTSSKSSKLIHGGLRYLKHFDFQMTRESCIERNLLLDLNPHLIEPLPFMLPIYKGDKEGPLLIRMAMWLYELLSSFDNYQRFDMLSKKATVEKSADLRQDDLRGAAYYFDAWADDARLTVETIKAGVRSGGIALNKMRVQRLLKEEGQVVGVEVCDRLTGQTYTLRGSVVLNATGTWVDAIRNMDKPTPSVLRPTKGVHIVVPRNRVQQIPTMAFTAVQDQRLMFSIPFEDVLIIGTTDTHYDGPLDDVVATTEDVDYILTASNHMFPNAKLTRSDILSTFAGLRPLVGSAEDDDPGAISREHEIFQDPSGLISIAGGKLTTYRIMARELVDLAIGRLDAGRRVQIQGCVTDQPIAGVAVDVEREVAYFSSHGIEEDIARHLVRTYGPAAGDVLELAHHMSNGFQRLMPEQGYILAEALYATREESAASVIDVLTRRIRMALWSPGQGLDAALPISQVMAKELGWSEAERQHQVTEYQAWIARHHQPVPERTQSEDAPAA